MHLVLGVVRTLRVSVIPLALKLEKPVEPRLVRLEKPEVSPVELLAEFNALLVFVCPSERHPLVRLSKCARIDHDCTKL